MAERNLTREELVGALSTAGVDATVETSAHQEEDDEVFDRLTLRLPGGTIIISAGGEQAYDLWLEATRADPDR